MSIPKIIHQIWVGDNPLPAKSETYIKKIKELHPEYEYKLWKNDDITPENFINYKYIVASNKNAQKADIMRYEILYNYGGIYLDIDMEVYKSLTPLLTHSLIVCNEDDNVDIYITNAFIACEKRNPQLLNCVSLIKLTDWTQPINKATGPSYFKQCIKLNSDVRLLPTCYCYPIHWSNKKADPKINDDTFMCHHWDKNW